MKVIVIIYQRLAVHVPICSEVFSSSKRSQQQRRVVYQIRLFFLAVVAKFNS